MCACVLFNSLIKTLQVYSVFFLPQRRLISLRTLVLFIGEWYFEAKIWMLGMLADTGVSLLGTLNGQRVQKYMYIYCSMYPHISVFISIYENRHAFIPVSLTLTGYVLIQ